MKVSERPPFEIPHEGDEFTRAARQKIDDDINKLQLKIRSLKKRRNKLSPIFALPIEVISKIFIFVRDSCVDGPCYHQTEWIRVGHVCHHWREVALGYPSLWSVFSFTKPDLVQEAIQRSKMAALTIFSISDTWTPRRLEQLKNAMGHLSRIRSINFVMTSHFGKLQAMLSSLSRPASLLEEIGMISDGRSGLVSLPADALSNAPRLHTIELIGLSFSWESAMFKLRNLTTLRLKYNCAAMHDTSTMSQMMNSLDHLPNLHDLQLSDSIPSCTTSDGSEKILEFRHLERLVLGSRAKDCIFFLRHIRYPPGATVKLRCSHTEVEDCITSLSLIGQNLRCTQSAGAGVHQSPVTIRSAQLTSPHNRAVELIFYDTTNGVREAFGAWGGFPDPVVHICFRSGHVTNQNYDHLLTNICNFFDLSSLENLLTEWNFSLDSLHAIWNSLGKLPKLKFIYVNRFLPGICHALTEAFESLGEEPEKSQLHHTPHEQNTISPVTVFSALRTLLIESVDFRQLLYPENIEYLVGMLMARANMDMPIDKLSLIDCRGVWTWQRRRLGELVVDFEFDGKDVDVRLLDSRGERWHETDYSESEDDDDDDDIYDVSF